MPHNLQSLGNVRHPMGYPITEIREVLWVRPFCLWDLEISFVLGLFPCGTVPAWCWELVCTHLHSSRGLPCFGTLANASVHTAHTCGGTSLFRAHFGLLTLNFIAPPGPTLLLAFHGHVKEQMQVLLVRTMWESLHAFLPIPHLIYGEKRLLWLPRTSIWQLSWALNPLLKNGTPQWN